MEQQTDNESTSLEKDRDEETSTLPDLVSQGKNSKLVLCKRCSSKILRPEMANYVEQEHFLPFMKKSQDTSDGEVLPKFWMVDNIYTFENVGFSNTVGNTKYLTCADCEIGPIGLHDIETKQSFVAIDRVNHKVE